MTSACTLPAPLCVIADSHRSALPLALVLADAVAGGARWIRVRDNDRPIASYLSLCIDLLERVPNEQVTWSVRPAAHELLSARYPSHRFGAHYRSSERAAQGVDAIALFHGQSVHLHDSLPVASLSYLLLSPIFETASKPGVRAIGVSEISALVKRARGAVVALGGVTVENAVTCMAAGASAVAVCGAVLSSSSPSLAVTELLAAVGRGNAQQGATR